MAIAPRDERNLPAAGDADSGREQGTRKRHLVVAAHACRPARARPRTGWRRRRGGESADSAVGAATGPTANGTCACAVIRGTASTGRTGG